MSSVRSALAGYFGSAAGSSAMTSSSHAGGSSEGSSPSAMESQSIGEIVQLKDGSSYKIIKLIAEGGFSYVFLAEKINSGQFIAIKKILSPDSTALTTIQEEVTLLKSLQHRNIVHYIGYLKTNLENYILMEYCSSLPLPSCCVSNGGEELVGNIFLQCCSAVEYLHNQKIIHRDVKLENFLVGQDGYVKLVDFGSATREFITPNVSWSAAQRCRVEEAIHEKTTPMYRPPEVLDLWLNYSIDTRLDLWALGCLLYLLSNGTHPFPDSNKLAIINAKYSITKDDCFVPIIRGLLRPDPAERMTFQQIYDGLTDFHINKLSFKAPTVYAPPTGIDPAGKQYSQNIVGVGSTIASTSSSLFSSLKGGAESLFKNIKENFKAPADGMGAGPPGSTPPRRGSIPAGQDHNRVIPSAPPARPSHQPPPRPTAPKPSSTHRDRDPVSGNQDSHNSSGNVPPPLPEKPHVIKQEQMFVDNLLDLGDIGGAPQTGSVRSDPLRDDFHPQFTAIPGNTDLLDDLFGGPAANVNVQKPAMNVDLLGSMSSDVDSLFGNMGTSPIVFGEYSKPDPVVPSVILNKKSNDLLGDIFGDIPAKSAGQPMDSNVAPASHIPNSSSFGSLFQLKPERASGPMVKNVSTPNLTELILEDKKDPPMQAPSSKPNYNRAAFEDEANPTPKKNNLNEVFGEFLKSEGFSSSTGNGKNQTINDLRRVEMVNSSQDPIQLKISLWREGKKKNIRALLASLHTITWEGCNWTEVSMSQMITETQVKKIYRKACLCIHPDKQVGNDYELLAKAIFVELNEAWSAFEAEK